MRFSHLRGASPTSPLPTRLVNSGPFFRRLPWRFLLSFITQAVWPSAFPSPARLNQASRVDPRFARISACQANCERLSPRQQVGDPTMRVTVYGTKPYDRRFLDAANCQRRT